MRKILEADWALKRPFSSVTADVVLQIVDFGVGLIAIGTRIGSLTQMHRLDVLGQQRLGDVVLFAALHVTDEATVVGVHPEMQRQLRLRFKALGAKLAEKGQLSGMGVKVFLQMLILLVRLGTKVAFKWFLPRVGAHVNDEQTFRSEQLIATRRTLEGTGNRLFRSVTL